MTETATCLCDDEYLDCEVHVHCDQNCRALFVPVTLAAALAAVEHWRLHEHTGGCSHGH